MSDFSLLQLEHDILKKLRNKKPARKKIKAEKLSTGERLADSVAEIVGSWRFILIQSVLLFFWLFFNAIGWWQHWDPYPFILLNLVLSFQAAYTAPVIMMSQNRHADIDRLKAQLDYDINLKAELEIEYLHQKINEIKKNDLVNLMKALERIEKKLDQKTATKKRTNK